MPDVEGEPYLIPFHDAWLDVEAFVGVWQRPPTSDKTAAELLTEDDDDLT